MPKIESNPAYDGAMGIFEDYMGCDSGINCEPEQDCIGCGNGYPTLELNNHRLCKICVEVEEHNEKIMRGQDA